MADRLELFPITAKAGKASLTIAGCDLEELARQYGTPLYLYDAATLDAAVDGYRQALASQYPGEAGITYAGKAFLCLAIAQWAAKQGLLLDCTGAGEIAAAVAAGVPRAQLLVHGVNKSQADIEAAQEHAGTVVVDNLAELFRWSTLAGQGKAVPELWLRLRPGLAVKTHQHTQTGQEDSKFGMDYAEALEAAAFCRRTGLPLVGLHFHQGSHFHDLEPLGPAIELALELSQAIYAGTGWVPPILCPGGGWGVAYNEDELPHPPAEMYVQVIAQKLVAGCKERGLPLPRLQLEPGRSLVARAGVALYRVGTVKETRRRRWLLLDGGLADNPRPALYGARYSALPVRAPKRPPTGPSWLGGPFCESGDVLIEGLPLPDAVPGDLIAVPVSGAYQLSMASNYNGAAKPAVVWLEEGKAQLVRERERVEELWGRDKPLS